MTFEFDSNLEQSVGKEANPLVKGRCLHIDADFLSYYVTYDDPDDSLILNDCVEALVTQADTLRTLAGCDSMCLHFTHPTSNKAGRYDIAIQQPYQEKRGGTPRPRLLNDVRIETARRYAEYTGNGYSITSCISKTLEADDTLRTACEGNTDTVLWSNDKDLKFTACLHLTDDYKLVDYSGFGTTFITQSDSKSKGKKLDGFGTKFFFAQLLLGDSTDNIKGCASISRRLINKYMPSKPYLEAVQRIKSGRKLTKALDAAYKDTTSKPLGLAAVIKLLDTCNDELSALRLVRDCYKECYGDEWYSEHTKRTHNWYEIFLAEADLLWIKRYPTDTSHNYFTEVIHRWNTFTD